SEPQAPGITQCIRGSALAGPAYTAKKVRRVTAQVRSREKSLTIECGDLTLIVNIVPALSRLAVRSDDKFILAQTYDHDGGRGSLGQCRQEQAGKERGTATSCIYAMDGGGNSVWSYNPA